MKNTITLTLFMILGLLAFSIWGADAVKFTSEPKVIEQKDGISIEFSINRYADLAVEALNSKGAGLLGDNAPEPLKPQALSQSLFWDRKDDLGKDVATGEYLVRVGLGLHPHLKKLENANAMAQKGESRFN